MWLLTRICERKKFSSSGGDWEPFDCFHLCGPWKQMRENSFLYSNEVERPEGGLFGKTVQKVNQNRVSDRKEYLSSKM